MFHGKMENLKIEQPIPQTDDYNYSTLGYKNKGVTPIHIVVQDRTHYNNNDMSAYTSTLVGYTEDERIDIGWKIDGKYIVETVMPHRHYNVLYLQEVKDYV